MATKKTPAAAMDSVKPIEAAVAAQKDTVEKVVKAGTEAATRNYEQALAMTKDQVAKTSQAMFKGYDDLANLGKDNVDAVVQSGTIVAKGYETLGKEVMAFAQTAVESNVAAVKALFGAKTLREVIDLQAELSRYTFDSVVAESARLTEMSVKVANEAIEPIQKRVNVTVEAMIKPIAA